MSNERVRFLLARIRDDQTAAQQADGIRWRYQLWNGEDRLVDDDGEVVAVFPDLDMYAMHAGRHHPAHVMAECEAKRRLVGYAAFMLKAWEDIHAGRESAYPDMTRRERHTANVILETLAGPYVGHPDCPEEWRP